MEIVVEPSVPRHRGPTSSTVDSDTEQQYMAANITNLDSPEVTMRQRRRLGTREESFTGGDYVFLDLPDNEVEEHKMTQNYMFGFKKWKSHLTVRPLDERSDVVKDLYEEPKQIKPAKVSTVTFGNVLYVFLVGWILALVYSIMAVLMFLTLIGKDHGFFCFKLARYFLWPFGYFVQEHTEYQLEDSDDSNEPHAVQENNHVRYHKSSDDEINEATPLTIPRPDYVKINTTNYWKRPSTYVWLILGVPVLFLVHAIIIFLTWFTVVLIPVCKLNLLAVKRLLLMPPEKLHINKSSTTKHSKGPSEVVMCSYEAVNLYYYKYTVDGMNVILVNLLVFVVITLLMGYLDNDKNAIDTNVKFVMGLVAIVPLAYYIGMGIASISAQSTHAIGAVLNATFGSIVEIILYVSALLKYEGKGKGPCYEDLVQSALTGTLLATMLLVPGICMIVGGLKHSEQRFNMKSAAVSASLLFISIAGAFTPTIFSKTYGNWMCSNCTGPVNSTQICLKCHNNLVQKDGEFYNDKVLPLIYICVSLSLFAYVVGLVFTLKTHAHILEEHLHAIQHQQAKSIVHWGRIKSSIILLLSVVAMSLCAEVVVQNMEPILTESGVSEKFIGVTILALVPDIPEIVNGVQFAMKNNISLSIDIGSSVAVQVCLLQIPVLVLINAVYPLHFHMVFNDLHLWSVIISVIIMNFLFNDGKANYFQGTTLCVVYIIMLSMYFFAPDETNNMGCLFD